MRGGLFFNTSAELVLSDLILLFLWEREEKTIRDILKEMPHKIYHPCSKMVSFSVDGLFAIDRVLILPLQSLFPPPYTWLVSFFKTIVRFFTRKSQLHRLLESKSFDTLYLFHHRLRRTRPFSILEKKVGDPMLFPKLMQFVEVSDSFAAFKDHFNELCDQEKQLVSNKQNTKQLLEDLKQAVIENGILPKQSFKWSDLGFQGEDPITDLRSTGIASLLQLTHLVRTNTALANTALSSGYSISFACIAINCTAFLRDCLLKKGNESPKFVLDKYLLVRYQKSDFQEIDFRQVTSWMFYINDLFIRLLELVDEEWRKRNPPNIMGFPSVFAQVKVDFLAELQSFV